MVLGLKGQGHRVNKCIFRTDHYAYVNAHMTDSSNSIRYGVGLDSLSAYYLVLSG